MRLISKPPKPGRRNVRHVAEQDRVTLDEARQTPSSSGGDDEQDAQAEPARGGRGGGRKSEVANTGAVFIALFAV